MAEIPKLEIYSIILLPSDKEKRIERLEKELNKEVLAGFGEFAYVGKLCKNAENNFCLKYQNSRGVEEKIIELDSTNVIFVKQI